MRGSVVLSRTVIRKQRPFSVLSEFARTDGQGLPGLADPSLMIWRNVLCECCRSPRRPSRLFSRPRLRSMWPPRMRPRCVSSSCRPSASGVALGGSSRVTVAVYDVGAGRFPESVPVPCPSGMAAQCSPSHRGHDPRQVAAPAFEHHSAGPGAAAHPCRGRRRLGARWQPTRERRAVTPPVQYRASPGSTACRVSCPGVQSRSATPRRSGRPPQHHPIG